MAAGGRANAEARACAGGAIEASGRHATRTGFVTGKKLRGGRGGEGDGPLAARRGPPARARGRACGGQGSAPLVAERARGAGRGRGVRRRERQADDGAPPRRHGVERPGTRWIAGGGQRRNSRARPLCKEHSCAVGMLQLCGGEGVISWVGAVWAPLRPGGRAIAGQGNGTRRSGGRRREPRGRRRPRSGRRARAQWCWGRGHEGTASEGRRGQARRRGRLDSAEMRRCALRGSPPRATTRALTRGASPDTVTDRPQSATRRGRVRGPTRAEEQR